MPLPDLIEIVPLTAPVRAEITVPGSKSITNRALVLAALADGETTLTGALWSEDTQVMVECLQELGFMVNVAADANEFCNRTITVYGKGGEIPGGGTAENPLELFVGNAGTAARFLAAMVCLGSGVYRLSGVARMHERPQAALFAALRELGYRVDATGDKLPAVISPKSKVQSPKPRRSCTVSIEASSQFASALLLCAGQGGWDVKITGENAEESPYVAMTTKLISCFPEGGAEFEIEPDASSASYFLGADSIAPPAYILSEQQGYLELLEKVFKGIDSIKPRPPEKWTDLREALVAASQPKDILEAFDFFNKLPRLSDISLQGAKSLVMSDFQIDSKFRNFWPWPPDKVSRNADLGDSIMTLITLAPLLKKTIQFTDLGRLRVQECERVVALRTELTKCGAKVVEEGDTLTVYPSQLHGAEIETYNDHRMAMCFAVLGLKVPGIRLQNPSCVKKTFPNFFQKLATAPPHGLGATILDARTGRKLTGDELFAD